MEKDAARPLIAAKLADGGLPHDSIPRVEGGPGNDEVRRLNRRIAVRTRCVGPALGAR